MGTSLSTNITMPMHWSQSISTYDHSLSGMESIGICQSKEHTSSSILTETFVASFKEATNQWTESSGAIKLEHAKRKESKRASKSKGNQYSEHEQSKADNVEMAAEDTTRNIFDELVMRSASDTQQWPYS